MTNTMLTISTYTTTDQVDPTALTAAVCESFQEVYPEGGDPVVIEPHDACLISVNALRLLLNAAEVALDGHSDADLADTQEAWDALQALRRAVTDL